MAIMIQAPSVNDIELSLLLHNRGWQGNLVAEVSEEGVVFGFLTNASEMIATAVYDYKTGQRTISYLAEEED